MDPPEHALLLVEDSPDDGALTLVGIDRSGVSCGVEVIRHGDEVLAAIHAPGALVPNLILLDFHLPGLNGLEILREIRKHERTRGVPVVMLSALASDRQVAQCLSEGANSCVEKPMKINLYVDHVGQIVRYWLTIHKPGSREFTNP